MRTVAADPGAADLLQGFRSRGLRVRRGIDPTRPADLWVLSGEDAPVRLAALRARGGTTPAVILGSAPSGRAPLEPVAHVADPSLVAFEDAARRAAADRTPTLLQVADGVADLVRARFVREGASEELEPIEADVLAYLAARAGRTISRAELQVEVWGHRPTAGTRAVDRAITRLQEHLGQALREVRGGVVFGPLPASTPRSTRWLSSRLPQLRTREAVAILAELEANLDGLRSTKGKAAARCVAAWEQARGDEPPAEPPAADAYDGQATDEAVAALTREGRIHDAIDALDTLAEATDSLRAALVYRLKAEALEIEAPDRRLAGTLALRTARVAAALGDVEGALAAMDRHRERLPRAEWRDRELRASLLLQARHHSEAVAEARAMDLGRLSSPASVRLQVLAALDQGRPRHAVTVLDQSRPTTQLPEDLGWHGLLTAAAAFLVGSTTTGPDADDPALAPLAATLAWAVEGGPVPDDLPVRDRRALDALARDDRRPVATRIAARVALRAASGRLAG